MRLEVNNEVLLNWHQQLIGMRTNVLSLLLNNQIKYFQQHNEGKINALLKQQADLYIKYFEVDAEGKIITETPEKVTQGVPQPQPKPKMKPFMLLASFEEEYKILMGGKTQINAI